MFDGIYDGQGISEYGEHTNNNVVDYVSTKLPNEYELVDVNQSNYATVYICIFVILVLGIVYMLLRK